MYLREVYDRYKHLDEAIKNLNDFVIQDLWEAVKYGARLEAHIEGNRILLKELNNLDDENPDENISAW